MRIFRPVIKTVGNFSITMRDVNRLQQVARILARHGMGMLASLVPGVKGSKEMITTPERLVQAIQEMGPTFIKLGQILSTRPDVVPQSYIDKLQSLQDDVSALPFSTISEVLKAELGADWKDGFQFFDETPLATASIAQVHRATLPDGRSVVLKIQRPGIEPIIKADLHIIEFLLGRALEEFPEIELFDPKGIFSEFHDSILSELNFEQEKKNLLRFSKNFEALDFVKWPHPVEEFCTPKIITMDYLDGISIRDARSAGRNMPLVGERYLEIAYSMLFKHGFFHGDLHPGNVLILEDDLIGIIDCGMIGRLSQDMKSYIASLIYALHRGDSRSVARLFFDISIKEQRVDFQEFERDAVFVAEKHWSGGGFKEMDIVAFLMDLSRAALRHRVRATPAFTMFFKGVMTTEGLAKSLLPEVDPLSAAQPYVEALVKERFGPEQLKELAMNNFAASMGIINRLPIAISQFMDDLDQQRLQIRTDISPEQKFFLERLQRHRILALFSISWMFFAIALLYVPDLSFSWWRILAVPMILITLLMQLFLMTRRYLK